MIPCLARLNVSHIYDLPLLKHDTKIQNPTEQSTEKKLEWRDHELISPWSNRLFVHPVYNKNRISLDNKFLSKEMRKYCFISSYIWRGSLLETVLAYRSLIMSFPAQCESETWNSGHLYSVIKKLTIFNSSCTGKYTRMKFSSLVNPTPLLPNLGKSLNQSPSHHSPHHNPIACWV